LDFYKVRELLESSLQEQLTELPQIDSSHASILVDEYHNLRTVSWATTSDVTFLENTYDLDCHELRQSMEEHDLYRGEFHDKARPLMFPERRKDELRPDMRNVDFDALPYDVEFEEEAGGEVEEQSSLADL
jgi:hypothetical protein